MQGAARRRRRYIAAVAAAYLCFGMAWIVLSDALLAFVLEPAQMQRISTAKGLFFVLLSAALVGLAVHHAPADAAASTRCATPRCCRAPWAC
jgi:predicted transporter